MGTFDNRVGRIKKAIKFDKKFKTIIFEKYNLGYVLKI